MTSPAEVRARWLAYLHSTDAADRPRAEAGVRSLYTAAGFGEPDHLLWYPSPCAASWAVAALVPKEDRSSRDLLDPRALSTEDVQRLERARTDLRERVGARTWDDTIATIGPSKGSSIETDPSRTFAMAFVEARYDSVEDLSALFDVPDEEDVLGRAENHLWGSNWGVLNSALHCPTTGFLLRRSFVDEQTFSSLAADEARVGTDTLPPILRAAGEIARSAGLWWPYEHAAILTDRPSEIHVNDRRVPHREDGPAIVYRDGWQLFAWNGKAVPERWIMQTESVPAGEYRGFDPSFAQWVKSKVGSAGGGRKRAKPGSIAKAVLPSEHAARLEQLRAHAGGRLPLHDRYVSGEHREVWKELIAIGAAVREDQYAADALAVAYETMERVEFNVQLLVKRLTAMGYTFAADGAGSNIPQFAEGLMSALLWTRDKMLGQRSQPQGQQFENRTRAHVPPGPSATQRVAEFEKEYGTLPLSLRAFYEVVGEVNLTGRHPTIDPPGNPVASDPLFVYGLDEGLLEYGEDEEDEDEEGAPSAITIAPDDLHKANVSGGSPYTMAFPDARADGELLDERHGLFFVEYLRLCFEFGGFPGYEGRGTRPQELLALAEGLVAF
jgi:hypothetical protein